MSSSLNSAAEPTKANLVKFLNEVKTIDLTLDPNLSREELRRHYEVCPANWHPGSDTIKPGVKESKAYFEKQ
ncbi:hypothetical protein X798_07666 [Onchocerca flexuosa]|uniref:Peroxiredoxin C-terminal domain-containing protein n=1 Tax=Onchocerca flexuosa TaxID=387005 RepID=A0A238BJZ6_9BILA|nr:hypothetical protein X798_07666 [Onchocerca flexuosa]